MKRGKWKKAVGLLLVALVVGAGALWGEDVSYWNKFKAIFIDWDDNAPPSSTHTEVVGTRGINVEQALGSQGYDWSAVAYMEDFMVKLETEKLFLQEAGLGPFQQN